MKRFLIFIVFSISILYFLFPVISSPETETHQIKEMQRISLNLFQVFKEDLDVKGYQIINGKQSRLPIGSKLDKKKGVFFWLPGPGFIGEYEFIFESAFLRQKKKVKINISSKNGEFKIAEARKNISRTSASGLPFGTFETPGDSSTVKSSIAVTGWALDDGGISTIKLYRLAGSTQVFIGDAILVEGARPDVAAAYPNYPNNTKAGWGYMLLTNFLPNGGNGTFKIRVIATDTTGNSTILGTKKIYVDNANAVKPFGAIDTPTQGGTASGSSYVNWGWVLTPQPNSIPIDGSTINVFVDGVNIGHPTYNVYKSDIANLFPGYANSNGAVAYFYLDTTQFSSGVHTIQWTATDSGGNSDGIGSRYFTIQTDLPPDPGEAGKATIEGIDSDNDGVRDDVQIAIHNRYPNNEQIRALLTQETKAIQEALIAGDTSNTSEIINASRLIANAMSRLQEEVNDPSSEISFLENILVNTSIRSEAYIEFNAALNGQFFGEAETTDYAATNENECFSGDTTHIYFINGVWNTYSTACLSRNLLKRAYKQSLESQYPEEKFYFKLAYNYNAGKVRDIIEVIGQKLNEINDPEANQLTAAQYFNLYMTAKAFDEIVPISAKPLTTTIEEYLASRITATVNASWHIQMYQNDLQEGRRVLLIAHSQGNLFANQAVSSLMEEYGASIGMIGVASPAAVTYNNSTYYTAHDDRVIDALRLIQTVLPSNIDNDPGLFNDPRDFSNHQFAKSYFTSGLESRKRINEDVTSNIANLQFPGSQLGSGAITVTLKWGSEPDVDLHVTEPNGTHVYYGNLSGISGYLDLDDTNGYGPEHYYVACETLETGTYSIGVNYYYGIGPETATVQISTSDGNTRTFTKYLTISVGCAGNNSPKSVCTITVSKDENGKYKFEVN